MRGSGVQSPLVASKELKGYVLYNFMVEDVIIRPGDLEDISGIMKVQDDLLLKNQTIKSAEKNGFLVYPIKEEELEDVINSSEHFLFVAIDGKEVVGYALAYPLDEWRNIKLKWNKRIIVSPKTRDHLDKDRVIYFRHIARKTNYPGIGALLEKEVYSSAKEKGYGFVVTEILEHPISNEISKKVHEEKGYLKIGQANYLDGNFWGLYELELK